MGLAELWYKALMPNPSMLIAVIDDEEQIRRALSRLLNSAGMAARSYSSAEEFLSRLCAEPPACAVVDLQMPNFNGLELLKCLRDLNADFPVVMITAHDEPTMRERCFLAGAGAYLRKPFDEQCLLKAIGDVCHFPHPI